MERAEKEQMVEVLKGIFESSGSVVLTQNKGLTVAEMNELRAGLREVGASVRVVKNRLAKIALKGKPGEGVSDLFTGPVAVAYAEDFVSAPKAIMEFVKENDKLEVLGGFMDEQVMDKGGIEALAKMPSREELIGTVALRLLGPVSEAVSRLTSQGSQLAGAVKVIEEQAAA